MLELHVWLCPLCALAVAKYMSAPETLDQDTVLPPHNAETETFLGGQGPGNVERRSGEKERLFSFTFHRNYSIKSNVRDVYFGLIQISLLESNYLQ